MSRKDEDEDEAEESSTPLGYLPTAAALERTGFTVTQLRALATAGIVRTSRLREHGGATCYCIEDLDRFEGMPRNGEAEESQDSLAGQVKAITEAWKSVADIALKQTKQAQDHERLLVAAFSKPLENLGESSKALVTAVLEQNGQLVKRANDGDHARLEFVKGAESMLRDQRTELREQAELDRKHDMRREVWEGVKKAAPHLLPGLKETLGSDRANAAAKLAEKLDPAKVAALIHYQLLGNEEIDLLCTALGLDRAAIEALNAAANAEPEPEPEPAKAAE